MFETGRRKLLAKERTTATRSSAQLQFTGRREPELNYSSVFNEHRGRPRNASSRRKGHNNRNCVLLTRL